MSYGMVVKRKTDGVRGMVIESKLMDSYVIPDPENKDKTITVDPYLRLAVVWQDESKGPGDQTGEVSIVRKDEVDVVEVFMSGGVAIGGKIERERR